MRVMRTMMAALLVGMAGIIAQGATISYDGNANVSVPGSVAVNVQQFDSALGTLTGVTLSIVSGSESATLALNNAGAAETWTVNLGNGTVTFGDGTHTTVAYLNYMVDHDVAAGTGIDNLIPTTTLINPTTPNGTANQSYGSLASYIGTGYVSDMTVSFAGFWGVDGLGEGDSFGVPAFNGTAHWMVTYTYTIPEPTSMGLLALGVAALGLRRRTRKTA